MKNNDDNTMRYRFTGIKLRDAAFELWTFWRTSGIRLFNEMVVSRWCNILELALLNNETWANVVSKIASKERQSKTY